MDTTFSRAGAWIAETLPLLRPHPNTGRLWIDLIFLIGVGAFHHTILPAMTGGVFIVDIMTPWLITGFVMQSLPRNLMMLLLGSFILETHSTAPAGLYVCAYWMIAAVLLLVRSTLSWRHVFPWLSTFAVGQLWIIAFENFYQAVGRGGVTIDSVLVLQSLARLVLSVGLGMILCRRFMKFPPTTEQV